jgi:hypothetical protein
MSIEVRKMTSTALREKSSRFLPLRRT